MKVILYSRVSTDDKEQDPERQLIQLRKYCDINNHEILAELKDYHTGDSYILNRPEGAKIKAYNKVEGILVFSIDRYSREHPTKIFTQLNEWNEKKVKIVSITEPAFNMESDFAEITIFLVTWFNNYFLKRLKMDIKSGMERARKEGKRIGAKKAEFNKYRAYELLFNQRMNQRKVAEELKVSASTINRFRKDVLNNPSLFINLRDNKELNQDVSVRLVSETFKEEDNTTVS